MDDLLDSVADIGFGDEAADIREQMLALSATITSINRKFTTLKNKVTVGAFNTPQARQLAIRVDLAGPG